jgi:hypothetical protein
MNFEKLYYEELKNNERLREELQQEKNRRIKAEQSLIDIRTKQGHAYQKAEVEEELIVNKVQNIFISLLMTL